MQIKVIRGVIDTGEGIYHPGDRFCVSDEQAKRLIRLGVARQVESETQEESPVFTAVQDAVDSNETTKDGKPTVEALETRLNKSITATERDEIWDNYQTWLTARQTT